MDALLQDLKHAARAFRKTPGFTVAALAALTLGIAANTAIFSVVNTVLLKPFAYRDPGRIVMFQNTFPAARTGSAAPTEFNWWRQHAWAFEQISAYEFNAGNWTGESFPEQIPTMRVSADFFRLCGAAPALGRTFSADNDLPNVPKTAVLAYGFWQRRFGGDSRVIGRRMTLDGERYEIIGVAAPDLQNAQIAERSTLTGDIEIHEPPDVYLPFQLDPNSSSHGHFFNVAGRIRPGITLLAANSQLQATYAEFARKWPEIDMPGRGFGVQPLRDAIVGGVRSSLLLLFAAVSLVLLIACANVANLLLARATVRKREIAIRAAIGAGRARLVRRLLTESLMLSLAGGALGLAAGYAGVRALLALLPGSIPRIGPAAANVVLDWRVLSFTLAVSFLTAILFGLAPALQSSRADLTSALKESHQRAASLRRNHARSLLVSAEMALAVVLLISAALLIRSFLAIRHVNPGFDPHHVLTMRVALTGPEFANRDGASQVIRETLRRLRALPGVDAAAASCCIPLEDRLQGGFQIAGRPDGPDSGSITGWALVSAGYFETFKIPLLRGRIFTERDETGPPVVIINQTLAQRFWPNSDPLHDQIIMGDQTRRQIIGVVADVHDDSLDRRPRPNLYLPSGDGGGLLNRGPWAWMIRTRASPLSLRPGLQKELTEATGGLPIAEVRTMEETVSRSMATENFRTLVFAIFAGSALLLAAIGIYGLMAYAVAQRIPEIGIRLALGAESRDIRTMLVVQGLRPAVAGMACGLAAAFALARFLRSFLFGVAPWDPFIFCIVPLVLIAVALAAVWLPALRAGRVDPSHALRHEQASAFARNSRK